MSDNSDEEIVVNPAKNQLNSKRNGIPLMTASAQVNANKGSRLASIEIANMHGYSRRVYKEQRDLKNHSDEVAQRCPCCNYPVAGTEFSLCCSSEELSVLGASFPLIFKLNRYLIIALVAVCAVACIPCLIDNIMQGKDEWTYENSFNLLTPATYGKDYNVSLWQPCLHVAICGLLVFYYMWIMKTINEKSIDYDTANTTPSDFTLIVRGLPSGYKPEELQKHIEDHFKSKDMKIAVIVPTYNISEYVECTKMLADYRFQYQLVKSYEETFKEPMKMTKCCRVIELQGSDECLAEIRELEQKQKILDENMDRKNLSPIAFVTFTNQIVAREIAEEWSRSYFQRFYNKILPCYVSEIFKFKGAYIYAEMAPDHTDINWENLATRNSVRYFRKLITVIVSLLTISIACAIMAATSAWKVRVNDDKENQTSDSIRAATIIPSIITVIINFIVARMIRIFSAYEKHSTWTDFYRSVLSMLIIFIFLNNIGIPMLIYLGLNHDWFSKGGLAYTVFWLEIMNAFVSPAILLVNPKNIIKKIKQMKYAKQEKNGLLRISQKEANMVFEGPEVDLADRFANILKNFTMCLFYAPIVPVGPIISIFGLIVEMGIFKYSLIKVCSLPKVYPSDLVKQAASWIKISLLLYSLGILIFYSKLVPELLGLEIFFFIAMSGYVLTPISLLCKCCFKDKALEILRKTYNGDHKYNDYFSVLDKFYSDYERENPVTQPNGIKRWRAFVDGKNPESYYQMEVVKITTADAEEPEKVNVSFNEAYNNPQIYPDLGPIPDYHNPQT